MAHPRTQPMTLPGWVPLTQPPPRRRRRSGAVARWWWPILVVVILLAVVAFVLDHDSAGAGVSVRGLVALALAVVVLAVLTIRRRWGPLAVFQTLTEYTIVAVLVVSLVALAGPDAPASARESARRRPQPARVEAADRPSNPLEWLAEQWRRAGELADRSQPHAAHSPTAEEASL
jgi:hypothetical protein